MWGEVRGRCGWVGGVGGEGLGYGEGVGWGLGGVPVGVPLPVVLGRRQGCCFVHATV